MGGHGWQAAIALLALIAALIAGPRGAGIARAQAAINLAPPPVPSPTTTGAQIGAVDPNELNNPAVLKPIPGSLPAPAGSGGTEPFVPSSPEQASSGACALYDSWCAYCAHHPAASHCKGDEDAAPS